MIELADLGRIILAVVLGAIIGYEREISGKAAGLRTNVLICMGAALFTVLSKHMGSGDSATRIAAQVVTGVGFLGAGAIIQDRGGVHGLTTAATIWLVASIGMACGAGFYLAAAIVTLLAVLVLLGLTKFEIAGAETREQASTEQIEQPQAVEQEEPAATARKKAKKRKRPAAKRRSGS